MLTFVHTASNHAIETLQYQITEYIRSEYQLIDYQIQSYNNPRGFSLVYATHFCTARNTKTIIDCLGK
jgi:hypothetical protein